MLTPRRTVLGLTLATGLCANAYADAMIGPKLKGQLIPLAQHDVIVTFDDKAKVKPTLSQFSVPFLALNSLPMANIQLTTAQINALSDADGVSSIYLNAPLEYSNYTSGEITGGHYVQDIEGFTGKGVTVAVLDSGIDGTHPDLTFGETTIQNVKLVGDLDLAGGVHFFLEDIPNTDTSSGHGTHVAATVSGSGKASENDARRPYAHDGIAPDAKLIGLGAGEGLNILFGLLGFDYALTNQARYGIDVITNSWGGGDGSSFDPFNPINQASFTAYKNGMVVLFAASNSGPDDNTLNQYAIAPWVINVAAGTATKGLADFSSRGVAGDVIKQPDITAPGQGITSARAINTVVGATGPVLDLNNPDYYATYLRISGTSMATPFVAGTVALLLEANPQLSPDQIEHIIKVTAEPMPEYAVHQVGAGYIDVKAAEELAKNTVGERSKFMQGDTLWAQSGNWRTYEESSNAMSITGQHSLISHSQAEDNQALALNTGSQLNARLRGDRIRLHFVADEPSKVVLFQNGEKVINIKLNGNNERQSFAFRFEDAKDNTFSLVTEQGTALFDGVDVDGELLSATASFGQRTEVIEGTMGPSAENIQFIDHPFEVTANMVSVQSSLTWSGVADLDYALLDSEGNQVASAASLDNPEVITYFFDEEGTYTFRVNGYISGFTPYQITHTITEQTSQ